jgi:hypothetical protein
MPTTAKCPKCDSGVNDKLLDGCWCHGCTLSERTVEYCPRTQTPLTYRHPQTNQVVSYKRCGTYIRLPPELYVPDGVSESERCRLTANINLYREKKKAAAKRYREKTNEAKKVARIESNPASNQPSATGAQKARAVNDMTQLLSPPSYDVNCDAMCISKVGLDSSGKPKDKEGIFQSTLKLRNPLFLERIGGPRGEFGDVVPPSNMVPLGSKNDDGKGLVIEIVSCVTGEGSEQTALDCELAAQKAFENKLGRLWKVTGNGKRIGSEPGDFGVQGVVYKNVIHLIKQRVLVFNKDQEPSTIDMIMKFYPWATEDFWVKPNYDDHIRFAQYQSVRNEQKKAAAAAGTPLTASDSNKNKRKAEATDEDTNKKTKQPSIKFFFGAKKSD